MTLVFKVWDASRINKKCITFPESTKQLYISLMEKASHKLKIVGELLVLETDGTQIDDDESLKSFKTEVLLLLQEGQNWEPVVKRNSSFTSLVSTVTVSPTDRSRPTSPAIRPDTPASSSSLLLSESSWSNFTIPIQKFSSAAQRDLRDGTRDFKTTKDVIHVVASEMMELSENIPSKAFKIVANKLVSKFPGTFMDKDDDNVTIGDGTITIYNQLKDHVKYVKATKKRRLASNNDTLVPVSKRKKLSQCRAGCMSKHWQPAVDADDEHLEDALKHVDFAKFDDETKTLMERAFAQQRRFLNNIDPPPSLQAIKERWPILLTAEGIFFHFQKLMTFEITNLTTSLLEKAGKLLALGLKKKIIREMPIEKEEKILTVLKVITSYFSENLSSLICSINEESDIEKFADTNSPKIVYILKDGVKVYLIIMDKQKVNDGVSTLENALKQMFALYYNLNLEYPKAISNTMELMQMYFLKIHPPQGSRSKKAKGKITSLLNKLRDFFIQEFVADPHDGVTLLLELLRAVQLSQGSNGNSTTGSNNTVGRIPPSLQRRALLDELTCLQCLLCCCVRYSESVRRLAASSAGLFTLAVCIMSNVNKSRIIALQLLTKACEPAGNGHSVVSEAMSTLRLRFGEPVRFRFLVGMLISAGGQGELLACGFRFINTFLDTSGSAQRRLYVQAELEQAGLDISVIKKIISINSPSAELVFEELDHWEKNHIDVETLAIRAETAEKQNDYLRDKVLLLERRIQILQEEKGVLMSLEQCLKERCSELQDEVTSLKSDKPQQNRLLYHKKDGSTPAEDEGISSSERSLSPEDIQHESSVYEVYSIQNEKVAMKTENKSKLDNKLLTDEEETTIDDVIQELKNIINDAETEVYTKEAEERAQRKKEEQERARIEEAQISNKIQMRVDCNVLIDDPIFDSESEIVPSNLHPQPPRRTRSLIHLFIPSEDYDYNNKEIFFENETPYTSDEGSDSLLSASKCRLPRIEKDIAHTNNNRAIQSCNVDSRTRTSIYEKQQIKHYDNRIGNIKKSESFHHVASNMQIREVGKNCKSVRHNSVDGFFVANYSQTTIDTPLINQHRKVQKALEEYAAQKIRSKSLDRIDDGLDTMVDIVVTNKKSETQNPHLRPQSDSGNTTGTTLSRSTSNVFLNSRKDFRISKLPMGAQKCEDKHKIFLPNHHYQNRDNEVHYYFPRIQEKCNPNNNFLIKRGHTNAGMYSGFHIVRTNSQTNTNTFRKAEVPSGKNKNQLNALSKVTDLPSGLY